MNLRESHGMQPFHVQAEIYIYDLKASNTPVYIISIHHLRILHANKNKFLKIISVILQIYPNSRRQEVCWLTSRKNSRGSAKDTVNQEN